MSKLFEKLKKGLEEIAAHKKGELELKTKVYEVHEKLPTVSAVLDKRAAYERNCD